VVATTANWTASGKTITIARMRTAPPGILPVIAVDRTAAQPLHRQVYQGYRDGIVAGRLRPGQRLPSTRALARELGISRVPVVSAFEQLLAEGYIESAVGSGTFVARTLPDAGPPRAAALNGTVRPGPRPVAKGPAASARSDAGSPWLGGTGPFRMSEVATAHFPFDVWASLVTRHARNPQRSLLGYGDPMGHRPLREALADYLRTARAVRCQADQIMVVSGSQHALEIAARVLLDPGSPVCIEEPGYAGVQEVLARAGARVVPVRVDAEGLDVDAAEARCPSPRAVYVTPSHQYPLGVTMSAARRLQLLDWARRRGAWVLEDDYDSEYRYGSQPIAALQGLDRDARVVYIGTFSKVLFPSLRVGYVVVPRDLVPRFAAVRQAIDILSPAIPQAVLTDFLQEGHFGRHLRRMRTLYGARRDALVAALRSQVGGVLQVQGDQAGVHLVATFARPADDRQVAERAARAGLWVMPLSSCYAGRATRRGLVLGYGGAEANEMGDAVRRLERALA
jgi:GntR family transcriptional regulator/MocR family aminotransferase